jgi:eukaryotic-like serine/threonine-protein kinase
MLNRQLGPYTILAPLGAGGMGEVYRARDNKLGRDVAIKILPSHFTADPERRARFAREARTLATLNHPHIGAIYGLEEAEGVSALVLELVEGPTLADRLERGALRIPQALTIARQIAEALNEAHEHGIIHRDLKPANIVLQGSLDGVSNDVRAKVLDFGLAKPMTVDLAAGPTAAGSGSFDGTADGRILGTPAYMSPQQARADGRQAHGYLGLRLRAVRDAQRTPRVRRQTISDTLAQVLEREPDWSLLPAGMPPALRILVQHSLRRDPERRLHDIADARIELEEMDASAGEPPQQASDKPGRVSRERLAWTVASALGAVAVVALFLYFRGAAGPAGRIEFPIVRPESWSTISGGTPAPNFDVSPDGRYVVVAASSKGVSMLWMRETDNPAWRVLSGTEGAGGFFWSPDSRSTAFFTGQTLKQVDLSGGVPVTLTTAAVGQVPSGAWGPDGTILIGGTSTSGSCHRKLTDRRRSRRWKGTRRSSMAIVPSRWRSLPLSRAERSSERAADWIAHRRQNSLARSLRFARAIRRRTSPVEIFGH